VRLPDAALLRLCGCPAAGAEVLHAVRARQAVRERELQQPRRPRSPRLCQQQGEAASAPRQRCDATLQYTRRCLVLVMLHAQYAEGQLQRAKTIKNRMLLGNELLRIVYPLAELHAKCDLPQIVCKHLMASPPAAATTPHSQL
jgi:hypothetical protein